MVSTSGRNAADFRLHHIGIVTRRERYADVVASMLGCLAGTLEDEGGDEQLDITGSWITVGNGLRLEVFAPRSDADGPINRFLARTGGGLHHVSFQTSAIDGCKAMVSTAGGSIMGESADHAGWAEFFLRPSQAGGVLLHWMQALRPTT